MKLKVKMEWIELKEIKSLKVKNNKSVRRKL